MKKTWLIILIIVIALVAYWIWQSASKQEAAPKEAAGGVLLEESVDLGTEELQGELEGAEAIQ